MSRVVVHLSDLHFGRADTSVVEPLLTAVEALRPDVIAVSGDLTQRAEIAEFQQARAFLDRLPAVPHVVVAGNHDVPLYNLYGRFVQRLARFHRYITPETEPQYIDGELAVVGLNTARSLTWKGGRVNQQQMTHVRGRLHRLGARVIRVVVTHHPFEIVGRSAMAMDRLAESGADILLSGHLHETKVRGQSMLVVEAGTAVSTRRRGEENSFNCLRLDWPYATVEHLVWSGGRFELATAARFEKRDGLWISVE